jgi:hypothetical protein
MICLSSFNEPYYADAQRKVHAAAKTRAKGRQMGGRLLVQVLSVEY